ncbi:MAG TPA: LysR family transcriptional regulator [Bacilli bacterium]
MELRQLQYVIKISEELNFSRAAEKLHIAQPSLSQQLSKLEKELGVILFQRSTNSVELTYAGQAFVENARKIIDSVEQLKQEMDDISQMRKGKLIVGSLPITGSHILPKVLPVYKAKYPQVDITLIEDTTDKLIEHTTGGQTDISLLALPLGEQMLEYQTLVEEEIRLAVPPAHRFATRASLQDQCVELSELRDEPFVVLKKGQGFRQLTFDLCRSAGFTPNIMFESSNIETVQSLVAAGMGIAFVPVMVTRVKTSEFVPVYLPLAKPRPTRTLVIAYRKGRYLSKAADAFIATLLDVVRKNS